MLDNYTLHQHMNRMEKRQEALDKKMEGLTGLLQNILTVLQEKQVVESLEEIRAEEVQMTDMKDALGAPFKMDYEKIKEVGEDNA